MKIFKCKYIACLLALGFLYSCATESVKEFDEQAVKTDPIFQAGIDSYIIDGKISSDRQKISNAASDAWNVHTDYPNKKIVISTTQEEFENYKNSNIEFKMALEDNEKANNDVSKRTDKNQKTTAVVGIHGGKFDALNYPNNLIFHYNYNSAHYIIKVVANTNTTVGITNVPYVNSVGDLAYKTFNVANSNMLNTSSERGFLRNTSNSSSKTITCYLGYNYTGNSKSTTLAKNSATKLIFVAHVNARAGTVLPTLSYK